MKYPITNQPALRDAFWGAYPSLEIQAIKAGLRNKRQNQQCATVRCAWVEFVDAMQRDGQISEALAQRATL